MPEAQIIDGKAFAAGLRERVAVETAALKAELIQNTQNRDNAALQAKLDELIRISAAENRYIGIERLTDKELEGILDEVEENAEIIESAGAQAEPGKAARRTTQQKAARKRA